MAGEWIAAPSDTWIGRYGSRGVWITGVTDAEYLPENVRFAPQFLQSMVTMISQNPSTAAKAIHKPDGLTKIQAMTYRSGGATYDVKIVPPTDTPHQLTFYIYDHYGTGASLSIEILDLNGQQIDAPIIFRDYQRGIYVTKDILGSCIARIEKVASGSTSPHGITAIFLDPPPGPPPDNTSPVIVTGKVDETGTLFTAEFSETIEGESGLVLSGQFGAGTIVADPIAVIPMELESRIETELRFRITRTRPVYKGELVALSYQQGDIKDLVGNSLSQFIAVGVQNDSQAQPPVWQVVAREVVAQVDAMGIRTCQTIERLDWPEEISD